MGIPSRQFVHARHCHGADCRHDPGKAPPDGHFRARRLCACLIACLLLVAGQTNAEPLRVAVFHTELSRQGPGLLLRDIRTGTDPQVEAVISVVAAARADVLLLLGVDYDHGQMALDALADRLEMAGAAYPFRFSALPNAGQATGLDLDGDGRLGGPGDAQGFGFFAGQDGMALLSRLPINRAEIRDYTDFLWRNLPESIAPPETPAEQRLSTTAHWDVPITLPDNTTLRILAWHATPPVFDGPEDRNGRRNHDEASFWLRLLEGTLPFPPPDENFVLLGDANLDVNRSDGRTDAMRALLALPAVQDAKPQGSEAAATADFTANAGPGMMRVDYVLPSAGLKVLGAGVLWPGAGEPMHEETLAASRHRLVWIDLDLP